MSEKAPPVFIQPQSSDYNVLPGQVGPPPPGHQQGYAPPPDYAPPPGYSLQPGYAPQPGYSAPLQPMIPGQPAAVQWMARPEGILGCPPGLEYLTQIDQLLVQQEIDLMEIMTNWEIANKYVVKNSLGQQVFYATEESDSCNRQCCGPQRGFVMHITDNTGQEVLRMNREFKCCSGLSCCACIDHCASIITVETPAGEVMGHVRQMPSYCAPRIALMDANHEEVLSIEGPTCMMQGPCCTEDLEFILSSVNGETDVGKISKQWRGYIQEAVSNADNFGVSFPMDLDVKMKAVVLSAVFLVDFMFFQQKKKARGRR